MDKYKKYYGLILLIAAVAVLGFGAYSFINPKIEEYNSSIEKLEKQSKTLESKQKEKKRVELKKQKLKNSVAGAQKKIYAPLESDLGNDTLFFTLYKDLLEMVHANGVKIKAIDYTNNPSSDNFVKQGKDLYFVSDVDMELVSNYVNLGKLVQDIYQYPYYIRINEIDIKPYEKDKKVLVTNMSLRLYTHTSPVEEEEEAPVEISED